MTASIRPRYLIPLICIAVVALIVTVVLITVRVVDGAPGSGAPADPERQYLQAMEAAQPTVIEKVGGSEARLVSLGQQSCEVVRTGGSFAEAERVMQQSGLTADEASTVTYMANSFFCPRIG
jgi:hypothetical protein